MQYFPTSHIAEVNNYPYGRLQTTAFFGTEFKHGKGFRSTFQTINPKNGKYNAVNKQVYYPISLLYLNPETGHYKHHVLNPSGDAEVNRALDFVCEYHALFTTPELEYIAIYLTQVARAGIIGSITYRGADKEKALEAGKPAILGLMSCIKTPTLANFQAVRIDPAALDALEDPNYQPFRVANHGVGGAKIRVFDIQWDTDGEMVNLPTTYTFDRPSTDKAECEDWVAEKITEMTGYCHYGFRVEYL